MVPDPPGMTTPPADPILESLEPPQDPPKRGRGHKAGTKLPERDLFAPAMPTNGLDIMALWNLPPSAFQGGRLKISRRKYASMDLELIAETDIASYSMQNIASEFGPADYYLMLSPDNQQLWSRKNAKVSVSPQYAASCGFQSYPATPATMLPRISETRAMQATAQALDGSKPLTVADLASLVEMVADKTAAAMSRSIPAPAPPMGMEAMLMLWKTLTDLQTAAEERTLKLASRFMDGHVKDDEEKPEPTLMDGVIKALPTILGMLVPQAQVQPAPVAEPQIRTEIAPAVPQPPPNPAPQPEIEPMPTVPDIPMTEEERQKFVGSATMLRPFVPLILKLVQSGKPVQEVAAELADYVPWKLEDELIELSRLTQERGPACLALITPSLANPEGAQLVKVIAEIIQAEAAPE